MLALLLLLVLPIPALAQTFPALTGRVVDGAEILPDGLEGRITARLEAHEQASGQQVVVVTLPSLQGYAIAEYGVGLLRHWGIGSADKNDGLLLIVAPEERKVRIEVGYGLEGDMTDAGSKLVIENVILPHFRQGNMAAGLEAGTDAILAILGGGAVDAAAPAEAPDEELWPLYVFLAVWLLFMGLGAFGSWRGRKAGGRSGWVVTTGGFGGGGFGGSSGGGFSGGGGSGGGGGASGSW